MVDSVESMMMHGLANLKRSYKSVIRLHSPSAGKCVYCRLCVVR